MAKLEQDAVQLRIGCAGHIRHHVEAARADHHVGHAWHPDQLFRDGLDQACAQSGTESSGARRSRGVSSNGSQTGPGSRRAMHVEHLTRPPAFMPSVISVGMISIPACSIALIVLGAPLVGIITFPGSRTTAL